MSKNSKADRKKDEEKDLEEEHDEGSDDEDEGEEEADEKPAASAKAGAARPRARARVQHDDHDDHGHADEEETSDEDDPTWWAPHAVMSVLVLIGVLGFFGVFNKLLAGIAVHPAAAPEATGETAKPKPAEPSKAPTPSPRPGQPEGATGETYGAKHLLVMYKGSMRAPAAITRTEDEAKARATEALKKAKGGTKFEDLVKEYSDEPGAGQRGGDLGTFRKGSMVPEFQNAVEKMKVGDVSDLVKTPFGYHVILRTK